MKDEKKVQTNEVAEATDNQPDVEATVEDKLQKPLTVDNYLVLPELQVTRDTYTTNKGMDLWSYKVEVDFFGVTKDVGLRTPGVKSRSGDSRDKYGYNLLDTMLEVLGAARLAVVVDRDAGDNVSRIRYFAGDVKYIKGKAVPNFIQVETQKASSEGLLRSAINDLNAAYDLGLPML